MKLTYGVICGLLANAQAFGGAGLSYNGQSATPAMGWDTYNAYALDYNETIIRSNAERLVSLGFRDLGYNVIIFDDAMTERNRSANGSLVENAAKFPSGLQSLVNDALHANGLRFGVYSSAGAYTCGGYPGSLGHESEDANWWASYGADYLKYDNCYNEGQSGTPLISYNRYENMSVALGQTGRTFTYSLCNWGDDKPWEWASTISNSARISGDIYDSYDRPTSSCPCGPDQYYCELPGYACSVLNILGKASHITSKNQPGYWNDLDMLEVGNGGMTYDEYKTHFSMWAAIKSPLIMGNKLDALSGEDYAILINPAVLALNQDPLGSAIQRQLVVPVSDTDAYGFGEVQVWSGSLYGGDQVVAFVNAANSSQDLTFSLVDIFGGLRTNANAMSNWNLYDLWGNETVMPTDLAEQIAGGNSSIASIQSAQAYYFNATAESFASALARNETLLLGTPVGSVSAGGSISATVPRHGIAIWRLKNQKQMMRKRDEL